MPFQLRDLGRASEALRPELVQPIEIDVRQSDRQECRKYFGRDAVTFPPRLLKPVRRDISQIAQHAIESPLGTAADKIGRNVTIGTTGISGLAPAPITYSGVGTIIVDGGTGSNAFHGRR